MSLDPTHIPDQPPYDSDAVNRARNLLEAIPEYIGPYRILERIGTGGMGEVYRAEQRTPIRREVALKLIKLGMDTKLVIARFEAERQALALMDHPHIAKVFDASADDTGRPYFVMEYVKGKPITEYADHQRLSIPERLELFEQVCQAVQHAHHKGVIHRDLKPSNVLVCTQDGKPFSKVIDFGVAKAIVQRLTEKTFFTEHGQFVGTPHYMSPEQAEGSIDIDTRTDVYSLGVLLYELLTGSTPFAGDELRKAAFEQLKRMVIEVDPPKPSTRLLSIPSTPERQGASRRSVPECDDQSPAASAVPLTENRGTPNHLTPLETLARHRSTEPKRLSILVRGELDWIVMKALEKDRKRRYETPSSLATDIRSHLTGGTVLAAPPSLWYRTQKFARKYRYALIGTGTAFALLLLAFLGTTYGLRRARIAEADARVSESDAIKSRDEATKERDAKEEQRKLAEVARKLADVRATQLERQSYQFGLEAAQRAILAGQLDTAKAILLDLPEALRGWEWRYLLAESDISLGTVTIPEGTEILAHSPDGEFALLEHKDAPTGPFSLFRTTDGIVTDQIQLPSVKEILTVQMSRDARRIAFLAVNEDDLKIGLSSTLYVWDKSSAKWIWSKASNFETDGELFTRLQAISDDGMRILVMIRPDDEGFQEMKGSTFWGPASSEFNRAASCAVYVIGTDEPFASVTRTFHGTFNEDGTFLVGSGPMTHGKWNLVDVGKPGENCVPYAFEPYVTEHQWIADPSRVAVKQSSSWKVYSLRDRGSDTNIGELPFDEHVRFYSRRDCALGIADHQLIYSVLGERRSEFRIGNVPSSLTELCVDESSQSVFAYTPNGISRYPLFSANQIRRLAAISTSDAGFAPNGNFVSEADSFGRLVAFRNPESTEAVGASRSTSFECRMRFVFSVVHWFPLVVPQYFIRV